MDTSKAKSPLLPSTGEVSRALSVSIRREVADEKLRSEIAFHLAELFKDFDEVYPILQGALRGRAMRPGDLDRLLYLTTTHWPYHQALLARQARRAMRGTPRKRKAMGSRAT